MYATKILKCPQLFFLRKQTEKKMWLQPSISALYLPFNHNLFSAKSGDAATDVLAHN